MKIPGPILSVAPIALFAYALVSSASVNSPKQISVVDPSGTASGTNVAVSNAGRHIGIPARHTYAPAVNDTARPSVILASKSKVTTTPSLLSGCTVDAKSEPTCTVPSGWELVTAQGFEGGALPGGQSVLHAAIESGFAHSGTRALVGRYTGGDQQILWMLNGNSIASRAVYVSWWEFDDPQGKINVDFFTADRRLNRASGSLLTRMFFDLEAGYKGCLFNCTTGVAVFYATGTTGTGAPNFSRWDGTFGNIFGVWTQWEAEFVANDPGSSNGAYYLWKNGRLLMAATNQNLNGKLDMTNADLEVGGVYTYLTWWSDRAHTRCASGHSNYTTNYGDWSKPDPCPNQAPPNGYGIPFRRYFDDIVVLKR